MNRRSFNLRQLGYLGWNYKPGAEGNYQLVAAHIQNYQADV